MCDDFISQARSPSEASRHSGAPAVRNTDEREESRYPAERLIWLIGANGERSSARMINVSRRGFGLTVSRPVAAGERVLLDAGAGNIPAEIRWCADRRAGGVFLLPND